ncbi:epoxyqueuosine reductase QueH [Thiopseudomonas denitrificans]|uniref:Epoxyqueuosine reductase QueH n=1 Tax=Thiopseudomonas denitrificans TaxID=1501432 RepID=A0A4R6U0X6_9GAMM|nr:epoxyqueuosine reductase QueH [Thiopseudomonas denitrificans]TDQ39601.1 hypothetical protein DFQ45_102303 [Thiopseudomonas denitrificans]
MSPAHRPKLSLPSGAGRLLHFCCAPCSGKVIRSGVKHCGDAENEQGKEHS